MGMLTRIREDQPSRDSGRSPVPTVHKFQSRPQKFALAKRQEQKRNQYGSLCSLSSDDSAYTWSPPLAPCSSGSDTNFPDQPLTEAPQNLSDHSAYTRRPSAVAVEVACQDDWSSHEPLRVRSNRMRSMVP